LASDATPVEFRECEGRYFGQHVPSQLLRLDGKPSPLIICKKETSSTDLLSQNAIFLDEIFNDVLLSLVQPTSNGEDEKRKWIETGSYPQAHHGRLF
jgi:hypothetical protein